MDEVKNDADPARFVHARKEAESVKRQSREQCWERIGQDLAVNHQETKNLLYSLGKDYRKITTDGTCNVKDKNGNLPTEPEDIAEKWREYFSELLNIGADHQSE